MGNNGKVVIRESDIQRSKMGVVWKCGDTNSGVWL